MTDKVNGLTAKEVNARMEQGLSNVPVGNQSKTVGQIIFGNVFTYFNFIFAVFSALLIMVRSYINMTFLPVIVANTFIGIIQEIRAKRVLDKLTVVYAMKAVVIRDGKREEVDATTLVKDDLCEFCSGNQMTADAVIVSGNVRVNEALVTGESDEVIKSEGDVLLSGSFIVSGECRAVLTNVGHDSYAAKLALEAKAGRKKRKTDMMESLDKLVKVIGILIIPIGIGIYVEARFFVNDSVKNSVIAMVASLVGMIPEGLYLLASVALVVSVMRLGKQKVLVHEMNCVETLARVNVLCVDKTGTITRPDMSVTDIKFFKGVDDKGEGQRLLNLVSSMKADNATIKALKEHLAEEKKGEVEEVYPFSSENKYSGVKIGEYYYVIGAPEYLLLGEYDKYKDYIEGLSANTERVIIFGKTDRALEGKPIKSPVVPLAVIVLENLIRETAKETFEYFRNQGVAIKVISGDNPVTASRVAIKAGIENADKYIDATFLKTDEEIEDAVSNMTVFGRVIPEQKKRLIEAIKKNGKVVAMTGDGVNDVLALKSADCSIAMASGSEAASNAAQIVLLDSDFSRMPSVVLEGRRVVNNIQRSASLFLIKNILAILLTAFTLIVVRRYPLVPTQLSLIGLFTIGTPAFFLALQPNKSIIKGKFLFNVVLKAVPAGVADFLLVLFVVIYGDINCLSFEVTSTIATIAIISVGLVSLIKICMPFDLLRLCVCIAMIAGAVFSLLFLRPIFKIETLSNTELVFAFVVVLISIITFVLVSILYSVIVNRIQKSSKRIRKLMGN